ncbi:hypothetical protein Tco_1315006 [Tanacetum coccineum]
MVTSIGTRHAKPYTLRGGSSTKLGQRLSETRHPAYTSRILRSLTKPDRVHICTISGAIQYVSEEYGEERIEPKPTRVREATPILQVASSRVQRQNERVVEFKHAPKREGSRVERNKEGGRPLGQIAEDNGP